MTAQPSTKSFTSRDFTNALRNLSSGNSNSNENENENENSNFFNSQDFQRFLQEHASNDTTSTPEANSSLDQIFKTSELFKSHQFADLFKSQQSFSQMFQSKDSFAELFKSLDNDQKKAFFSAADSSSSDPLSPPVFPAMDPLSRTSSTNTNTNTNTNINTNTGTTGATTRSASRSHSLLLLQSKDWLNLGSHVDVNYQQSKLFRDTSSSYGSSNSTDGNGDEHMSTQVSSSQQMQQHQQQQLQLQEHTLEPPVDEGTKTKTNWGDCFFAQLQPDASVPPTPPPVAPMTHATVPTAVVVPTPRTLPVPLPKNNKSNNNRTANKKSAARKQGNKRYIDKPTETDILMGRGGKSNHHPGNKRYREEISNFKKTYLQLQSKEDKTDLSKHVVDYVHKYTGRFLAMDKTVKPARWYEITDAVARRKVSQALREDGDPVKRQEKRARFLERKRQKEQAARGSQQL